MPRTNLSSATASRAASSPPDLPPPGGLCAIHQPNLFPRLTTLAKLFAADYWIVLDDVQFTRRDYQHRTRLAALDDPQQRQWLTIPTHLPRGRQMPIREARIVDPARSRRRLAQLLPPSVQVLGQEEVVQAVLTGAADVGLVNGVAAPSDPLPLPDAGPVITLGLAEEPLAVLLPADHPLAHRPSLRLTDLADAHRIDAPHTAVAPGQLRAAAGAGGFLPHMAYDGTDIRSLGAMVAGGLGLARFPSRRPTGCRGRLPSGSRRRGSCTARRCSTRGARPPPSAPWSPRSSVDQRAGRRGMAQGDLRGGPAIGTVARSPARCFRP